MVSIKCDRIYSAPIVYTRVAEWSKPKASKTGGCSRRGFESLRVSMNKFMKNPSHHFYEIRHFGVAFA